MKNIKDLKIKIFVDGADIVEMKKAYKDEIVKGFTTNPYFLRLAGVSDYELFVKEVVKEIPDLPLSFEVISDDFDSMEREAKIISSWGENILVKIPVTNTKGESSAPLIKKLSLSGIRINATVLYDLDQVKIIIEALSPEIESIISVFAGRIGETGIDPIPIVKKSYELIKSKPLPKAELLWASTREVFNIFQAEECGCDIITVPIDVLKKIDIVGTFLKEASLNTVKEFFNCAVKSGYKI